MNLCILFIALIKALQPSIRGYHLRVEPKEYTIRRNIRLSNLPYSPRGRRDPILLHLYHQGLQMGLSHDLAARILALGQRSHTSNAYGNPSYGSPGGPDDRYGSPNQSFGYAPYFSQAGNVEYQQLTYQQQTDFQPPYHPTCFPFPAPQNSASQQLAPQQRLEYQQAAPPQQLIQFGQNANTEMVTIPPHVVRAGTTYYSDPSLATPQHQPEVPLEPVLEAGHSYSYNYDTYVPLNPIEEGSEYEDHGSYGPGPAVYSGAPGAPYAPDAYPRQSGHAHNHGYH